MMSKDNRPVSLIIRTESVQNGENSSYYHEVIGQLMTIGNKFYIQYKESAEIDPQQTTVIIKVEPNEEMQIIRSGENRMRLSFKYQEFAESFIDTEYGKVAIRTFASDMHVSLRDTPFSGTIHLAYELFAGKEQMGSFKMQVEFTT